MFIAALFTKARKWEQPRCPSTGEWIMKVWSAHRVDIYSALKKNVAMTCMRKEEGLEVSKLNEITQAEKGTLFSPICMS